MQEFGFPPQFPKKEVKEEEAPAGPIDPSKPPKKVLEVASVHTVLTRYSMSGEEQSSSERWQPAVPVGDHEEPWFTGPRDQEVD